MSSNQSSSTRAAFKNTFGSFRHKPSKEVPTGTVASRISYLQSLAGGGTRKSPTTLKPNNTVRSKPSPRQVNDVDQDRAGFGRRTSARFDYPVQRYEAPAEDPHEEKTGHRIMGWQIKRTKHETDSDNKSIKSNSSSKKGFRAKVKDVFTHSDRQEQGGESPEIVNVNTRTVSVSVNKGKDFGKDFSWEAERSEKRPVYPPSRRITVVAVPPAPGPPLAKVASRDFAEEALISGHKVHNWLAEAHSDSIGGSEDSVSQSVATTSTGRVRSVQQMYSSYGIPEPSELFSQALPPSRVAGREPRRCHVCKWINVGVERCSCCGHRLCAECAIETNPKSKASLAAETARLLLETDDEVDEEEESVYSRYSFSQLPQKTEIEFKEENWAKAALTARKRSSRQSPMSSKPPAKPPRAPVFEERFDLPQKNPSVAPAHPYGSGDGTSPPRLMSIVPAALYQPLREQRESLTRSPPIPPEVILEYARTLSPPRMIAAPEAVKAHKKSIVKDSPFLQADKNVGNRTKQKIKRVTHKGAQHFHPSTIAPPPSDSSLVVTAKPDSLNQFVGTQLDDDMSSIKCDSPTCRATHTGHRPYRHSISCSWKKAVVGADTAPTTPTSPKDTVKTLQMSPLMPKPLSPVKRRTDEMKSLAAVIAEPVVESVTTGKMAKENTASAQVKKVSTEYVVAPGAASPYSKAVVSVLTTKTELISPMGSDGHEDEHQAEPPGATATLHPPATSTRKTPSKRGRSNLSSTGSYSPTIISTGQITTIYETSIIEHPLNSKRGPRTHGRRPHRRSQHAPFSFSSDTRRPTRSSAERSHEELLSRKHKSHAATTFGFCPTTPHTHIIELSTEYIECHPESASMDNHNIDNHRDMASNNTTKEQPTHKKQGLPHEWRELKRQERDQKAIARAQSTRHNVNRDSIDHGTFATTRKHRMTNPINTASACMPRALEPQKSSSEDEGAMDARQSPNGNAEFASNAQGYGSRLKQLGDSVVHRGNSAIKKGWDVRDKIVQPRMRLADRKRLMEEQKKRVKYGDMDPNLMGTGRIEDGKYDTLGQPHNALSESEINDIRDSIEHSETSDEPERSSRTRYIERKQHRPDQQQCGQVHYRKDGVTHSRDMQDDNRDSLDNLATQPSFGTEYRHQSHPAQRHRRNSGMQTHHQSFAGHETFSHQNTGLLYSDHSSDSYFDENHSTMSGMSREIVFESGPHGKGAAILPVLEDEGRYTSGSDLEREQSRKVNRAGLRVSKSVRHIVGAAGPSVPVAMPIAVEDDVVPAVPAVPVDGIDMTEQERSVNRAGLRMSNSVRHIVGADGSASFSLTSGRPQVPMSSTYGSQSSADFSRLASPGMEVPGAPTAPRAKREGRSDTPSPSSNSGRNLFHSLRRRPAFQDSHRQTTPLDEEPDRDDPGPSREQPYYFASAPGLRTSEEERTRTQSFSASKLSLFNKLQAAEPEELGMVTMIYEGTSSLAVRAGGQGTAQDRELSIDTSEDSGDVKEPAQEPSVVANVQLSGKGKRLMDDAPRFTASKKRKLSEGKVASDAMEATNSFFSSMRGKSAEAADSNPRAGPLAPAVPTSLMRPAAPASMAATITPSGPTVRSHPSVQSLKERFSLPPPVSSKLARSSAERSSSPEKLPNPTPNPFRRPRREEAIQNLLNLVEAPKTRNSSAEKEAGISRRSAPPAPSAFSNDGARSRINTVSTQFGAPLPVVREASVSSNATTAHAASTSIAKSKMASGGFMTPNPAAMTKEQYQNLDTAVSSAADDEDVFARHDRNFTKKKGTSVAPIGASATPKPPASPAKNVQGTLISKQTQKCQLCSQIVLTSGMDAHINKCAEEIGKTEMRRDREAKEKKRAQKDKMEALARKHMGDTGSEDLIVFKSPAAANVASNSVKARHAQRRGARNNKSTTESGDTAEKNAKSKEDTAATDSNVTKSVTATTAKKGKISEIAKKFQQPPSRPRSANAKIVGRKTTSLPTATAVTANLAAPVTPAAAKKVSSLGGTDGASSGAPLMTRSCSGKKAVAQGGPNLEEMPIDVSIWIAGKFGIEPQEVGEVIINVGGEGERQSLRFEGWKTV